MNTYNINSPTSVENGGLGPTGAIRRQPFFPNRPIGRCSRSSVALFALRSRPAHRALNRHRGLAWTAHDHFSGSRLASSSILAPWAALSSACKPTSRERLSRRLIWRATGKFGCHFGPGRTFRAELRNTGQALISQACVPGFRSVAALRPRNDGDLGRFSTACSSGVRRPHHVQRRRQSRHRRRERSLRHARSRGRYHG